VSAHTVPAGVGQKEVLICAIRRASPVHVILLYPSVMARRSGRQTKAPGHFDPVLPIRDSSAQTSKKNKRPKRNLLTPANALQPNSPILKEDIQSLFASTILTWSSMAEKKKRNLIDNFPPAYRLYKTDAAGNLTCPISEQFAASDSIIKRDVARFKRDVEAGFYVKKWHEEGKRAMKERMEGQFDNYIKQHAEDNFGTSQEEQKNQEMSNTVDENKVERHGEGRSG
jgi:Asx homology domain